MQAKRLVADKAAAALKTEEERLHAAIIRELQDQQLTSIGGQNVRVELTQRYVPAISDWDAFCQHLIVTNDFSLIERRVSKAACKERWDDDSEVPGVLKYPVYRLSKQTVKG